MPASRGRARAARTTGLTVSSAVGVGTGAGAVTVDVVDTAGVDVETTAVVVPEIRLTGESDVDATASVGVLVSERAGTAVVDSGSVIVTIGYAIGVAVGKSIASVDVLVEETVGGSLVVEVAVLIAVGEAALAEEDVGVNDGVVVGDAVALGIIVTVDVRLGEAIASAAIGGESDAAPALIGQIIPTHTAITTPARIRRSVAAITTLPVCLPGPPARAPEIHYQADGHDAEGTNDPKENQ
jgi:hypothetical protein